MKQTGQTLVELVISITLILIIITAVTVLTVNGLKNSQFSRNQVQATKLAQEGIEKMRTIRDNNFTVCGWSTSANTVAPNGLWSAVCPGTGCRYLIYQAPQTCGTSPVTPTSSLWINYTPSTTTVENVPGPVGGVTFKREVNIVNKTAITGIPADDTNVKEITVTVSWTDSSGSHSSKVSTVLSKI